MVVFLTVAGFYGLALPQDKPCLECGSYLTVPITLPGPDQVALLATITPDYTVVAPPAGSCPDDGATADTSNTTITDSQALNYDANSYRRGVIFNNASERIVCLVGVRIFRSNGANPWGHDYVVEIHAVDGSLNLSGTALGTSEAHTGDESWDYTHWSYFSFSPNVSLDASTNYAISIRASTGTIPDSTNYMSIGYGTAEVNSLTNIVTWTSNNNVYGSPNSGYEYNFKIYYYD